MLANKKPRGRPPKNARPAMDPALRAAIIGQDNEQAEKENSVVLSLITSADKHQDYLSDEDSDSDNAYSLTQSGLSESRSTVNLTILENI